MDLGLAGRRAVVTGGSKGIGKAIAAELMAEGAAVVICSRHQDELEAAAVELVKQMPDGSAGQVRAMPCDVTDPEQVAGFVEAAAAAVGGLDILVNNAGGARPGQFGTLTDEDWHTDIDTKLLSQIRCTRAALPHLRQSNAPRVININAVYGRYPDPAFLASSVHRASCLSLAKALSMELGREGILVNSVNIGFVTTPQWENIHRRRAPDMPAGEFFGQLAAAEVPLGRFGRPDEVSGLVAFLAGDRASYLTGTSIDVAGGMGKYL
jgi:NAD(P)-dependent dehydrogenase (short-subunit alcohol dehydrogenase family)